MTRLVASSRKPIKLAPVLPNHALELAYRRRLDRLIAEMQESILTAVRKGYWLHPPEMAQDASPAAEFRKMFERLGSFWLKRFEAFGQQAGGTFARSALDAHDKTLLARLRSAGFSVRLQMSRAMNDALQATIGEQVGLITSIAEKQLAAVQGEVMRSIQVGGDLGGLTKALQKDFGVTRRRAEFIARDQNAKATATITRARQMDLDITHAVWMHSKRAHFRPSHLAFNGKTYAVAEGALLDGVRTWPGREINCRCVCRSVIPGLEAA